MMLLRGAVFTVFFYVWTAFMAVAGSPALPGPSRPALGVANFWLAGVHRGLAVLAGVRHEIRGRENLPEGPAIIAAKHQSAWDTLIFHPLFWNPAFVLKKELTHIPLFGRYLLKAGCIAVDRAAGSKALRHMVAGAEHALAHGQWIVIFPEGTRMPPGQHGRHHPGVHALYSRLNVPVVPVAVNSGLFWGRHKVVKRPGTITLEFLPPIEPGLDRTTFTETLRARTEEATRRLEAEARERHPWLPRTDAAADPEGGKPPAEGAS